MSLSQFSDEADSHRLQFHTRWLINQARYSCCFCCCQRWDCSAPPFRSQASVCVFPFIYLHDKCDRSSGIKHFIYGLETLVNCPRSICALNPICASW